MGLFSTPAGRAFMPARDRHIYILWIALVWAGMIAGFAPDLRRYLTEAPPPPLILHVHGAIYFLWLVAVTLQIALIERRNPALHRRLGWWLVGLSVALVPLGLVAAMVDMTRAAAHTPYEPEFLALEFQSMIVFAILLTLATRMRYDLAAHKRLMMLLTVVLLDPGTSRAWGFFGPFQLTGGFGWWFHFFWANALLLFAMIGWDAWRHGRVHPALIWGGALLAVGEAVALWLEFTPWWHVMAGQLVTAWGWAG